MLPIIPWLIGAAGVYAAKKIYDVVTEDDDTSSSSSSSDNSEQREAEARSAEQQAREAERLQRLHINRQKNLLTQMHSSLADFLDTDQLPTSLTPEAIEHFRELSISQVDTAKLALAQLCGKKLAYHPERLRVSNVELAAGVTLGADVQLLMERKALVELDELANLVKKV